MESFDDVTDYTKQGDKETLDGVANFSPKYQFTKIYTSCLYLQSTQQYTKARKLFYDNLPWYAEFFDEPFLVKCHEIIIKYSAPEYAKLYTYEQIEQLKYMRITAEFTNLLINASSKHRKTLGKDLKRPHELIPIGFPQVINYESMVMEFFNRLAFVEQQSSSKDVYKFLSNSLGWFGGIYDDQFIVEGYQVQMMDEHVEIKFRKLLEAFKKLLIRKGISSSAYASIIYRPVIQAPTHVDDVVGKKDN